MKVSIFIPCFIENLFPKVAYNTALLLEKLGCEVSFLTQAQCCGQPALNSGFNKEAKKVTKKFFSTLPDNTYIVMPSASCCGYLKNYTQLLGFSEEELLNIQSKQKKIFELSEFIIDVLKIESITTSTFKGKIAYHESCASSRELKLGQKPLSLLKSIPNIEVVELNDLKTCCGFGGTFSVKYSGISVAMGEYKIENIQNLDVQSIVSTDMSCLLQIDSLLKKHNLPIQVMHLADVLV